MMTSHLVVMGVSLRGGVASTKTNSEQIMKSLFLKFLLIAAVVALPATLLGQTPVNLGVEDNVSGLRATIVGNIQVGSDGEASWDPLGLGLDMSEYIRFPELGWTVLHQGYWVQVDPFTWVYPAVPPGGSENEPSYETPGAWYLPGAAWVVGPIEYQMFEPDGAISDVIKIGNFGPNNSAAVSFASDPFPTPDGGATIALLGAAVLGLAALRRKLSA
jgi:hypothetical protein